MRYGHPMVIPCFVAAVLSTPSWADTDLTSKFSNHGGISNTRHNMTQSTIGAGAGVMNPYRNDYDEVCVYCHTPHGSNATSQAPLWNHTLTSATYSTYDQVGSTTLTGTVVAPGPASLTCLSCHDGTISVDSIINMPGSGGYNAAQATSQNNAFLNTWNNTSGADASVHIGLSSTASQGCLACHSGGAGIVGAGATDFSAFALGTDLRNDHPIGVTFGAAGDLAEFSGTKSRMLFVDTNGNGRPDKNEVRLYKNGDVYKVECASCHDPHGVPTSASNTDFIASFLRKNNSSESELCFSCHTK